MICDQCHAEGAKSQVRMSKPVKSVNGFDWYWDEDDREHIHDGSVTTTPIFCSRGHQWEHRGVRSCPTCGVQVVPHV